MVEVIEVLKDMQFQVRLSEPRRQDNRKEIEQGYRCYEIRIEQLI